MKNFKEFIENLYSEIRALDYIYNGAKGNCQKFLIESQEVKINKMILEYYNRDLNYLLISARCDCNRLGELSAIDIKKYVESRLANLLVDELFKQKDAIKYMKSYSEFGTQVEATIKLLKQEAK